MNPIIELKGVSFQYPDSQRPVFTDISLDLPPGVTALIGQNGTGKSTMLLLAGGRLFPDAGSVTILGRNSGSFQDEEERNRYVSFIYQNMEFETEDSIGALMEFIYQNGFHDTKRDGFIAEIVEVFELEESKDKKLQDLSKGAMQRAILSFSLLYGSEIIMMDEPIFALEDYQKRRAMNYMCTFAREQNVHLFYSIHETELSEKYSDNAFLFYKNGLIKYGPTKEIMITHLLEDAYEIPRAMLHQKEHLYRENLIRLSDIKPGGEAGTN